MYGIDIIEKLIFNIQCELANDDDIDVMDFHIRFLQLEGQLMFLRSIIEKSGDNEGIEQGEL